MKVLIIITTIFMSVGVQANYIQQLHQEKSDFVYYVPSNQEFINPLVMDKKEDLINKSISISLVNEDKEADPVDLLDVVKDAYRGILEIFK